jgi:hypothetical protein
MKILTEIIVVILLGNRRDRCIWASNLVSVIDCCFDFLVYTVVSDCVNNDDDFINSILVLIWLSCCLKHDNVSYFNIYWLVISLGINITYYTLFIIAAALLLIIGVNMSSCWYWNNKTLYKLTNALLHINHEHDY